MAATIAGAALAALIFSAAQHAPLPMVPADAKRVIYIPSPDGAVENTAAFLKKTSADSALLSEKTVESLFDSAMPRNAGILNLQALRNAGVDTARELTISQRGNLWIACYFMAKESKADIDLPTEREKNEQLDAVSQKEGAFLLQGIAPTNGGSWRRGIISLNDRACTTGSMGNGDVRGALLAAKTALQNGAGSAPSPLAAAIAANQHYRSERRILFAAALADGDIASISAEPDPAAPSLDIQGFLQGNAARFIAPPTTKKTEFPQLVSGIPLWMDISLNAEALSKTGDIASSIQRVLRHGFPKIPAEQREALKRGILSSMTGRAAMAVSGINKKYSSGNIHQIRQAVFAQIRQPEKLAPLLAAIGENISAENASAEKPVTKQGFTARIDGGDVWFGIEGSTLYFANNSVLVSKAMSSLQADAIQTLEAKPASLRVLFDGKEAAEAIRPISMFDITSGPLFANLFALKMDFSELLKKSSRTVLTAVSRGGKLHFQTVIDLSGTCRPCEAGKKRKH